MGLELNKEKTEMIITPDQKIDRLIVNRKIVEFDIGDGLMCKTKNNIQCLVVPLGHILDTHPLLLHIGWESIRIQAKVPRGLAFASSLRRTIFGWFF